MDKNILTPLGKIVVYVNDAPSAYDFSPYDCKTKAILENSISACYIISVPSANAKNVRCVIEFNFERDKKTKISQYSRLADNVKEKE